MAYQWIIDGKIGCHFPERTGLNPNFDVSNIRFTPDGTSGNLQEIESVYYFNQTAIDAITAKSTTAEQLEEANKWRVWHRYWGNVENKHLLMQSNGSLEYKVFTAPADMTITAIDILSDTTGSNGNRAAIIDYDTGLTVGYTTNHTCDHEAKTVYGLTGYDHKFSFENNVYLRGLKKYCIAGWTYPSQESNNKKAYFENQTGTIKSYTGTANNANVDLRNTVYSGEYTTASKTYSQCIDDIMKMSLNTTFLMTSDSNNLLSLEKNRVYKTTSAFSGKHWFGIVDYVNYNDPIAPSALQTMSAHEMGVCDNGRDHIVFFERTDLAYPNRLELTQDNYSAILRDSFTAGSNAIFGSVYTKYGNIEYQDRNTIFYRNNYGTIKYGDSPLTGEAPANVSNGDIYVKAISNYNWGSIQSHESGVVIYHNNSWQWCNFSLIMSATDKTLNDLYTTANYTSAYSNIGQSNTALKATSDTQGNNFYYTITQSNNTTIEV